MNKQKYMHVLGIFSFLLMQEAQSYHFRIVVPSYNNEKYARRNLESLINQKVDYPFSVIVVNDCSQDKTGEILENVKREHNLSDEFLTIVHNKKRMGALANIYNTIHKRCDYDDIIVLVDGDDALAHSRVLQRVSQEYQDPEIMMTYGQFVFYPSGDWGTTYEIPREDLENKAVRTLTYVAQHLRTFKRDVFIRIKKEDLLRNGDFFPMNADMATMIPMLEMAAPVIPGGKIRSRFIPDILLIYNYDNPLNDHTINRSLQLELEQVIRSINPYEPIKRVRS